MHDEFHNPFEGQSSNDDNGPRTELDPCERAEVLEDLHELESFVRILQPLGYRGIVFECIDCDDTHYFTWGLLTVNLQSILEGTKPLVHEPAFGPDPDWYLSWDYARGYTDAWMRFNTAGHNVGGHNLNGHNKTSILSGINNLIEHHQFYLITSIGHFRGSGMPYQGFTDSV